MKRLLPAVVAWLVAAPAQAYLIDLNDARTVEPGTMELELQPIGYSQTLIGEEERYLLAPSAQLYAGLAEHWDVLFLTRGYILLHDDPEQAPYSLNEQFVALRRVLVPGAYSDEELEGPSLAAQLGVYLPGVEAEQGAGVSVGLLLAWQTDVGCLHANVWYSYTPVQTHAVFTSVAVEGPPDWPVRPTAELYVDVDGGEPYVSGLIGAVGTVTEEFYLQAGVRVGGWEDYADLEVRLSSWIYWELPGVSDTSEEEPPED